jgi:peptide/nickel transport system permease protein
MMLKRDNEWFTYLGQGWSSFRIIFKDPLGATAFAILLFFVLVALFAPFIAKYGPLEIVYNQDRIPVRMHPPSLEYWFGTTQQGRDVFSQVVYGTRSALIVGFLSAFCIVFVGTNVGLLAGYYGGWIDTLLMRVTDVFYGIPFLPFALVLVSIFRPSLMLVIAVIGFLMWRTTARVIRSQVLTLRQRKFIQAARASGSSHFKILYFHIGPNILPMCFLYMAFGVSWGVLGEASLSFLGLGDPDIVSWGGILYDAFISGGMRRAWWWTIPPGLCITLFVVGCFMIGRAYEEVINPRLQGE